MLEEFGLEAFSTKELKELILQRYGDTLKYIKDDKKGREKLMEKPTEKRTNNDIDFEMGYDQAFESLLPLYKASSGSLDELKCDIIGGDNKLIPLSELALKNAIKNPILNVHANEIVRCLTTNDKTWRETVNEIGKKFELKIKPIDIAFHTSPLRPEGRIAYTYPYFQTVLASGNKENKINYLNEIQNFCEKAKSKKYEFLKKEAKRGVKISLVDLEKLEYDRFIVERLNSTIKNNGRTKERIPFYNTHSLTFLENNKWGYRFRSYGKAEGIVKDITKRTVDAGLKVQKTKEKNIEQIVEERYFSNVIF